MEELEYDVTFPTNFAQLKVKEDEDESGQASVRSRRGPVDMSSVPVIFLLGWYGCQEKHLAKYSSIYQSNGYITIRYTLPGDYIFSKKKGSIKDVALKVLEAFFDLGLEENPIFFHIFSNGGGYVYRHITEIVNGSNPGEFAALKIMGVIYDSTPCYPTASTAYRAMITAMPRSQHWIVSAIKSFGIWIFFMVLTFCSYIWQGGSSERGTYYKAMLNDRMQCPQLFLYSKKDKIVAYRDIQAVIKERRVRGNEVRELLWDDSDHVDHLRKHPEEYTTACLKFVSDFYDKIA